MIVDLYYTNFVQVKYFDEVNQVWKKGIVHHDWMLGYDGTALKLDNIDDDNIIELDWRNLYDEEDLVQLNREN